MFAPDGASSDLAIADGAMIAEPASAIRLIGAEYSSPIRQNPPVVRSPHPVVHVDESGNTGEHLADPEQPVFTLAAVHVDDDMADRLTRALRGRAAEAHYTRLRKRAAGQERVLEMLADDAVQPNETVRVSVMHKPTMVVAKLIDLLVEPAVYAQGIDLYEGDWMVKFTDILLTHGSEACPQTWVPLMQSFIATARNLTPDAAAQLAADLVAAIAESEGHPVNDLLAMAFAPPQELIRRLSLGASRHAGDTLYPEVSLAYEQILWWGAHLGEPLELRYDESKVLGRWRERLLSLTDPEVAGTYEITPSVGLKTLPLVAVDPAQSHDTKQLQIADVFAGACAEVLRTNARGEDPSAWVLRLEDCGVLSYVGHWVWGAQRIPPTPWRS